VLAAIPVTESAHAQSEFLSIAPLRFFAGIHHAPDHARTGFSIGIERAIPVSNLLPQVSPDSYVEFVRAHAGVRFNEDEKTEFRMRATAVAVELQKRPWASSFSFLDIDASGLADVSADWISLGLGPGVDFGSRSVRFVAKGLLEGAVNSTRFGMTSFSEVGAAASETRHTVSYGVKGTAGVVSRGIASLLVDYEHTRYAIDTGIRQNAVQVALTVNLSRKVHATGTYRRMELAIDGPRDASDRVLVGLRYTPAETY
jgi:hypothetical protein